MLTIKVTLDVNANPPVTVDQQSPEVSGSETIMWVPAAGQTFTFYALTDLPDPPFSAPHVNTDSVTVSDTNGPGFQNYYPYVLTVTCQNKRYSTNRAQQVAVPNIHNR